MHVCMSIVPKSRSGTTYIRNTTNDNQQSSTFLLIQLTLGQQRLEDRPSLKLKRSHVVPILSPTIFLPYEK
jgi:hypothetical protein